MVPICPLTKLAIYRTKLTSENWSFSSNSLSSPQEFLEFMQKKVPRVNNVAQQISKKHSQPSLLASSAIYQSGKTNCCHYAPWNCGAMSTCLHPVAWIHIRCMNKRSRIPVFDFYTWWGLTRNCSHHPHLVTCTEVRAYLISGCQPLDPCAKW